VLPPLPPLLLPPPKLPPLDPDELECAGGVLPTFVSALNIPPTSGIPPLENKLPALLSFDAGPLVDPSQVGK
jgi:hypothetical protein